MLYYFSQRKYYILLFLRTILHMICHVHTFFPNALQLRFGRSQKVEKSKSDTPILLLGHSQLARAKKAHLKAQGPRTDTTLDLSQTIARRSTQSAHTKTYAQYYLLHYTCYMLAWWYAIRRHGGMLYASMVVCYMLA